jgi:signal transduction histidine kinase
MPAARGDRIAGTAERPVIVMWRSNGTALAMGAAFVDRFVGRFVGAIQASDTTWQLADAEERVLAGAREPAPRAALSRAIAGGGSAWTLRVWPADPSAGLGGRRLWLYAAVIAMLAFLWGATYLMTRTIRREANVARLQSEFVAAVSHEFRSPLTTMRQMAEMLDAERVPTEARRRQYYQVLVSETGRLQRLVETLLDFGRMEAGNDRYHFRPVDLSTLIASTVADMHAGGANRETQIVNAAGPLAVHADEDALGLALRNLIDNAIKYSPAGTTVSVRTRTDGARVAIDVIDQGPGIPVEEQSAIFTKFVRGRTATEGRVPGTGVGLAIVQRIAHAHGGDVQLASELGRGSTFTLWLPSV